MSSFLGVYGKNDSLKSEIRNLATNPDFTFERDSLFICAEGNPLNTHFHSNSEAGSGWISCGIGITSEDAPKVFRRENWVNAFENNIDLHEGVNGHFAVVKWTPSEIELVTDQLGMRNIFVHQGKDFVLFSTRLDWMLSLVKETSINWKLFGSNWLSINPFSSSCFVNGIERLAQGGRAKISKSGIILGNKRWAPKPKNSSSMSIEESLTSFSSVAINSFSKTSLGLSGGLDSRVLLALLASQKRSDFDLYTFEVEGHPDVEYATRLNEFYGFKHEIIPMETLSNDEIISELAEITSRTMLSSSVFNIQSLSGYTKLGNHNSITIDGAFGEIGRRRFLRGIELKARQSVFDKSVVNLLPLLTSNKADIFSHEVNQEMKSGLLEELSIEVEAMPDASEVGLGNWLDIFTIRTRVQNLPALSQGITDGKLFHLMPFLQPDLLQSLLSSPEKERIDAQFYRKIISEQAPSLSKVPLVKGDDIYPYWMKDLTSFAWIKTKRKLGLGYKNTSYIELIRTLEEYIRDTFSSADVIQQPFYDKAKIESLINNFFDEKDFSLATQLGWLLSFESFRKQVY